MNEDEMEPFYFGKAPRMLFGVYHSPQCSSPRDLGIVLCYPIGQEYMRSHRAFSRLAALLALNGFHVLRFDYSGCGDSKGNFEEHRVSDWVGDISVAVDELRHGSGVGSISLIGLRLGGSLSMMAACEGVNADAMVLWDPVVSGKEHVKELTSAHQMWIRGSFAKPKPHLSTRGYQEVLGYPFTDCMLKDLEEVDLLGIQGKPSKAMLIVTSSESIYWNPLRDRIGALGIQLQYSHIPAPPVWINSGNEVSKGMVPVNILERIISWLPGVL